MSNIHKTYKFPFSKLKNWLDGTRLASIFSPSSCLLTFSNHSSRESKFCKELLPCGCSPDCKMPVYTRNMLTIFMDWF